MNTAEFSRWPGSASRKRISVCPDRKKDRQRQKCGQSHRHHKSDASAATPACLQPERQFNALRRVTTPEKFAGNVLAFPPPWTTRGHKPRCPIASPHTTFSRSVCTIRRSAGWRKSHRNARTLTTRAFARCGAQTRVYLCLIYGSKAVYWT